MNVTIYTDVTGFEILAPEWENLLERAVSAPFFMCPTYQRIWWKHLGQGELRLIAVRTDEGLLVGLASLYERTAAAGHKELSFTGCVDVSDYLDVLVDADYVEPVYTAWLDALSREETVWDGMYLCSLPVNSPTHGRLAEVMRARGWRAEVAQQDVCPVITLPATWEEYLAAIDKKQRHEIRRKIRRIESEAETRWYVIDSAAELEPAMDSFIALHQKSTQDKEDFWSDELIAFFKEIVTECARAGWLKLYFIEVNGVQAASMLCFDYRNEFLLYNSGYDPAQFATLSPGNVLTSYTIEHAIELGRTRYDFLRGDEIYKFRFGAIAEPVYDLRVYRPGREMEIAGCS
jgi:CelD/BcsL family acetyltransferase involved in cellulose biosynthesis